MKNNIKFITLLIIILLSTGCSLPGQKETYPTWTTKGPIDSEKLEDGRTINGYQYLKLNDEIETDSLVIKVKDVEKYNEYNNYLPEKDNYLIVATIEIKNKTNKIKYIYVNDFPLMWNLDKDEQNYIYSLSSKKIDNNIITDKLGIVDTQIVKVVYEISNKESEPFAINYQELYEDDLKGISYYFYLS